MYLQDVDGRLRAALVGTTRCYRDVRHEEEYQLSRYSFELADADLHRRLFESALGEGPAPARRSRTGVPTSPPTTGA